MAVLEPANDCRLENINTDALTATLFWPGARPVTVEGVRLEKAFRFGQARLVVTSDAVPQEDGLHVTLVEADGMVADALTFRAPYTTGTFNFLKSAGDTLVFRFFGDTVWRVTVLPWPAPAVPFLELPNGVRRLRLFSKRLLVTGAPKPTG